MTPELPTNALRQSLSLPLIVLYDLGTTVGAGIYALTGKVAGVSGMHAPLSYLGAALLAGFTAFSFAELSARLPYLALPLIRLAELTAMLVLVVFVLCNVALIRIKLCDLLPPGVRAVPLWVPLMGGLTSAGILSYALVRPLLSLGAIVSGSLSR